MTAPTASRRHVSHQGLHLVRISPEAARQLDVLLRTNSRTSVYKLLASTEVTIGRATTSGVRPQVAARLESALAGLGAP